MTIAEIADQVGVHPNTVRFHLDTLVNDGRVEQVEPGHAAPAVLR
jgi:predicted ArsR family transcriptional regulator